MSIATGRKYDIFEFINATDALINSPESGRIVCIAGEVDNVCVLVFFMVRWSL